MQGRVVGERDPRTSFSVSESLLSFWQLEGETAILEEFELRSRSMHELYIRTLKSLVVLFRALLVFQPNPVIFRV